MIRGPAHGARIAAHRVRVTATSGADGSPQPIGVEEVPIVDATAHAGPDRLCAVFPARDAVRHLSNAVRQEPVASGR